MGYSTRVQLLRRKSSRQWFVGLPAALAEALELERGETIEWKIEDKHRITMIRKGMKKSRRKSAAD
jgi:antitoxin component of MazEF toxin-antitoxin module